jgi:hypothetical protein
MVRIRLSPQVCDVATTFLYIIPWGSETENPRLWQADRDAGDLPGRDAGEDSTGGSTDKKSEELIQSSMAQYRGGGQAFLENAPSSGRISAAQRRTGKRLQSQAGITKKV